MPIDLSFAPDSVAVTNASGQFATTLTEGEVFTILSTIGAWIAVGANPTAVVGTPSQYIPPNYPIPVVAKKPSQKIAIIRDGAANGNASLVRGDLE